MATNDLFKSFVEKLTAVPPTQWIHLLRLVEVKNLKKKETFFRQDEYTDAVGFVLKGLIYTVYCNPSGKERVKNFAWEGRLISPYASLITGSPCTFTATAIENTTLAIIRYPDLLKLYERHACWERMGRKAAENLVLEREKREFELLMLEPLERYESFRQYYAPIIDRIPQYLIASFLGITAVSLSRLMAKKNHL